MFQSWVKRMSGIVSFLLLSFGYILRVAQQAGVPSALSSILSEIYKFLISANPFILIILGIVIFFAGRFAKVVGIVMVLLGLIHLLLPYLSKIL
jgi:hypothetical protein